MNLTPVKIISHGNGMKCLVCGKITYHPVLVKSRACPNCNIGFRCPLEVQIAISQVTKTRCRSLDFRL